MGLTGIRLRRSEWALAALATVTAGAWLGESALASLYPVRVVGLTICLLLGTVVVAARLVGLGRWVVRKALWRVRHRMVAVFFFVGALPVTLSVLLLLLAVSFLFGPLTAYMLTTEVERLGERLSAAASPLALQLRQAREDDRRSILEAFQANMAREIPGLVVQAEIDGDRMSFPGPPLGRQIPPDLRESRGLVRSGGVLYQAIIEDDLPAGGRMLLAVPLTSEMIQQAMPGLNILEGRMERSDGSLGQEETLSFVPLVRADLPPAESGEAGSESSQGWTIFWPFRFQLLDLDTDELETSTYLLLTRPWDLWGKIFAGLPSGAYGLFRWLLYGLLAAFAANVLASLVVAASLTRTLTKAVHGLYVGTEHVNRGDFNHRIPVSGYDQVSDLARSFNDMTASLEGLIEESKKHQQLAAELEIAREVQAKLFPSGPPRIPGLQVLGVCRPALSVSGDFYDYMSLGGEGMAISFGDVSGKGISAALLMASLHSIMRAQCAQIPLGDAQQLEESAAALVRRANEQLHASTDSNKFSTLFFGAYDAASGTLAYANAGHLPPLLLRNGGAQWLDVTGPIVGAFPLVGFGSSTLAVESGDLLVAYSDGVTEPENAAGDPFGEDRLVEAVKRHADSPLPSLIGGVMDEVVAWTGQTGLQDDMTMMVIRKR